VKYSDGEKKFAVQPFHDIINSTQYNMFGLFLENNHPIFILTIYLFISFLEIWCQRI